MNQQAFDWFELVIGILVLWTLGLGIATLWIYSMIARLKRELARVRWWNQRTDNERQRKERI